VQPKPAATRPDQYAAVAQFEINLSGSHFLAGFATALCFVGVLLWAVLTLWLFEVLVNRKRDEAGGVRKLGVIGKALEEVILRPIC
jgi:hypothetical protein